MDQRPVVLAYQEETGLRPTCSMVLAWTTDDGTAWLDLVPTSLFADYDRLAARLTATGWSPQHRDWHLELCNQAVDLLMRG